MPDPRFGLHAFREFVQHIQDAVISSIANRISTPELSSTPVSAQNPYGWLKWVFDQLEVPVSGRLLEIGCGPAYLWKNNEKRLRTDWRIVLSDFSPGNAGFSKGRRPRFPRVFSVGYATALRAHWCSRYHTCPIFSIRRLTQ